MAALNHAQAFTYTGIGIHSGKEVQVWVTPKSSKLNQERSIWVKGEEIWSGNLLECSLNSLRNSQIQGLNGVVNTPEHFLAASLFYAEGFCVELSEDEFPMGDGSAAFWDELFLQNGFTVRDIPLFNLLPSFFANAQYQSKNRFFECLPSDEFCISYELDDFGILQMGIQDLKKCLKARSFIRQSDFDFAKENGLLKGASLDSGLLYDIQINQGVRKVEWKNGLPLRSPTEALEHKILDFLGDMALKTSALPRGYFRLKNTGHFEHHFILEMLEAK